MKTSAELNQELADLLRQFVAKVDAESANVQEKSAHSGLAQWEKREALAELAKGMILRLGVK